MSTKRTTTVTLGLLLLGSLSLWFSQDGAGRARAAVPADSRSLDGTRRIDFVRAFASEKDVNPKRSFLKRMVDFVAGPPDYRQMVRPYGITTDSQGRILITDPGALCVHIFDFERKKYTHLDGAPREKFESPIGVAVDGEDNIYVTDSRLGKLLVFDSRGKFRRFLGDRGGEGFFKRPTGIAIDPREKRIYLSDTLAHKIFTLDLDGKIISSFGGRGDDPGQFNFPTDIALRGDELIVVDAMNFRLQIFDREGHFRTAFGTLGDRNGTVNRPKGVATDSEGNIYVAENLFETVQIFNTRGQLLYYFGETGSGPGKFQLPAGVWIDGRDRIYVADSFNRRVEMFQFVRDVAPSPRPEK